MSANHQKPLLTQRRFSSFFWTQFFGAFNDNVFKNALVILISYQSIKAFNLDTRQLVALCGGLFILPFFLFSAFAGQLADKYPKQQLIRIIKFAEIVIMAIGLVGFLNGQIYLLFFVLFLMGLHSTFFGPIKYSILPQLVTEEELVGGNALVEVGTFIAILLGTIGGGVLASMGHQGTVIVGVVTVVLAVLGLLASLRILPLPAQAPDLRIARDPITPAIDTFRATCQTRAVFLSVLGISWFWFFGAAFLSLLPTYTKEVLHADEHVVTLFLSAFCIGIALGSLLCERFSDKKLELGLVPLGSIGISVFGLDLFFVGVPQFVKNAVAKNVASDPDKLLSVTQFIHHSTGIRIALDLFLLAIFSGFFTVPLYTLIQQRADAARRSRVIAGNNILNALFMVLSSVTLMALFALQLTIPQVFLVLSLLNVAVAVYIYRLLPEFLFRFIAWIITNVMYRLKITGQQNIPSEGPVLLVANHVSFVDWLILASASRRPARFVMYYKFMHIPVLRFLFRDAKVIPIASARESEEIMNSAFDAIARELEAGEVVCIFPEGALTPDGNLQPFRRGVERILERTPVTVVPMALSGMWGSFFSRKDGKALRRPFRRFYSRVSLHIGVPLAASDVTASKLAEAVAKLGGFEVPSEAPTV